MIRWCCRFLAPLAIVITGVYLCRNGIGVPSGPGVAAVVGHLSPKGVAVDRTGNLYVSDPGNACVWKVSSWRVTRMAGNGASGFGGDGGLAVGANLWQPEGIAFDRQGNLFISDTRNHRIRRVNKAGIITTFAGNGLRGYHGDAGPARQASLYHPCGLGFDRAGNLFIADTSNLVIRKVDKSGTITTVVGSGQAGASHERTPARSAALGWLEDVVIDAAGNLYISDTGNHRVLKVDESGTIKVLARGHFPHGLALASDGSLYFSNRGGGDNVCRVDPSGAVTTIAGAGQGNRGDGGPAIHARLFRPCGLAFDNTGALYVADYYNGRVRKVDANGIITTVVYRGRFGR